MTYSFRNLVFEGGGIKGIAYTGALEVLEKKGILQGIERVGGTSAGAITAVFLGLGYAVKEMEEKLLSFDFKKLLDSSPGGVTNIPRLEKEYGWYKGDYFRKKIGEFIGDKTGNSESTFEDIEEMKEEHGFKSLYFMGTNLSTGLSEVFSKEPEHNPMKCVADAVRISMSVPLIYASKRGDHNDVYVDGGILDNYPVKLFDRQKYVTSGNYLTPRYYQRINARRDASFGPELEYVFNKETLGFKLGTREEISRFPDQADPPRENIDSFPDYICALIRTVIEGQQNYHIHSDDWARTIYIDTLGVGTMDFGLEPGRKAELIESGRHCAKVFLDWYEKQP
jgi:NTE family protein